MIGVEGVERRNENLFCGQLCMALHIHEKALDINMALAL